MDSLCTAAARALHVGDPLGALKYVALRDDAPALALRGLAMAQLGDFAKSKQLLERAARAFGPRETVARARCEVARAEVLLAARELEPQRGERTLDAAVKTLDTRGDRLNALHGRLVQIRRWLLLGNVDRAERALAGLELEAAPAKLVALSELVSAEVALRRVRAAFAREAFARARDAARRASIPALVLEIDGARATLDASAARVIRRGQPSPLVLDQVETLLASNEIVVDACRRAVRAGRQHVTLATRPVLFALARGLAEAWPDAASRRALIESAFGARRVNDTHRARLRVEIGRLRRKLAALADVRATAEGFLLAPRGARSVAVLAPPVDGERAAVSALLADGEPWSTSALALALGQSQRTVQRALSELRAASKVRSIGGGRSLRWVAPSAAGITTTLLLPAPPSGG